MMLPALPAVVAPSACGTPPQRADEPGASGFAKLLVDARKGGGVEKSAAQAGPPAPGQRMAKPAHREADAEPSDATHATGCEAAADAAGEAVTDPPADGPPGLRGRGHADRTRKEQTRMRLPAIADGKGFESAGPVDPAAADTQVGSNSVEAGGLMPASTCALPLPLPLQPDSATSLPTDGVEIDDETRPASRGGARPALAMLDDAAQRTDAHDAGERTAAAALPMPAPDAAPTREALMSIAQGTPRTARELAPRSLAAAPAAASPALASGVPRPDAIATVHVAAHIETPAFAPALATQLRWLAQERVQQAQITLNPAGMGPLSVQIVIDGSNARVDFSADHAATRVAIEASLPVLAAALDEGGLKLSGGGVHDGSAHRQPAWAAPAMAQRTPAGPADTDPGIRGAGAPMRAAVARGLVDLVA